jgi:hypothetical protein
MNPKPFASLNHFTVPLMRAMKPFLSPAGANCEPDPARTGNAIVGAPDPA